MLQPQLHISKSKDIEYSKSIGSSKPSGGYCVMCIKFMLKCAKPIAPFVHHDVAAGWLIYSKSEIYS